MKLSLNMVMLCCCLCRLSTRDHGGYEIRGRARMADHFVLAACTYIFSTEYTVQC